MSCKNEQFERCMLCQRYSENERHGYRDKPSEDIVICPIGGVKKWRYIDHEYKFVSEV